MTRLSPGFVSMLCFVLHAVRVFIGCVHSCYVLCCVAHSLCISLAACFHVAMSWVNMWLMSFLISCVFVSCFTHGWWFVYWPCACVIVLCEHMAFVLVFCVPCALMSIVLTPPILLPDYCLICPTCLSSLPSSFSSFIFSLCLQSCASSSSLNPICVLSCPVLSCPVLSCPVLSCPVLSCPVLSCLVLSCLVLSCPVLFGLSFWRHPFTAKNQFVSKQCNAKFLQICSDQEKKSCSWMAWE